MGIDSDVNEVLIKLDLVTTLKCITKPLEDGYQWMQQRNTRLNAHEAVSTIAFASRGESMVVHLTWSELTDIHRSYRSLVTLEEQAAATVNLRKAE